MRSNKQTGQPGDNAIQTGNGSGLFEPAPTTTPAVVVTGGSKGIGRAIAKEFLVKGHSVVLVARNADRLEQVAAELRDFLPARRQLEVFAVDVTRDESYALLGQHLAERGLHTDVLVNNAGLGLGGPFFEQSSDDLDRLIALNVGALTRWTRLAMSEMIGRGRGHIINMASLGGYAPGPNQAAYYASKAYVISLSEALSAEAVGTGVRVSVTAPGPVETGFHATMEADQSFYRYLVPSLSPERVAKSVYGGYRFGSRVIIPGLINRLLSIFMRILPHPILVPLVGWLLAQRGRS